MEGRLASNDNFLAEGADVNANSGFEEDVNANEQVTDKSNGNRQEAMDAVQDIVKKLGADVNFGEYTKEVECAAKKFAQKISSMFINKSQMRIGTDAEIAIWTAVKYGYYELVQPLIEAGADVNTTLLEQQTILSTAARHGHSECVDFLLTAGAKVDKKDIYGYTALYHASVKGYVQCVNLLLSAGADVNMSDTRGNTILMAAASSGSKNCVRAVLEAGADVNKKNDVNQNALVQFFANHSSRDVALLLYAAGEKIEGSTVHVEEYNGQVISMEIPRYLRNKNLDLCLKHQCRETIRKHLIKLHQHENLFQMVPKLNLPTLLSNYLLYFCMK